MSTLSTLKLVDFHKPTSTPPIVQRRNKVIAKLWEQQKLAESIGTGSPYAPIKSKRIKDIEGNIKQVEIPKRIKPWWFMAADGTLCLSVFYGSKRLELVPGKTSIATNNLTDLIKTLESIQIPTFIMGIKSDILCPLDEQRFMEQHMPNATLVAIDSLYGHDGFIIEAVQITKYLKDWLNKQSD